MNEPEGGEGDHFSPMWRWNGDPAVPPEPVALPDIMTLNTVESVDSIRIVGEARLLAISDEGCKDWNEPARHRMLDYGHPGPWPHGATGMCIKVSLS